MGLRIFEKRRVTFGRVTDRVRTRRGGGNSLAVSEDFLLSHFPIVSDLALYRSKKQT